MERREDGRGHGDRRRRRGRPRARAPARGRHSRSPRRAKEAHATPLAFAVPPRSGPWPSSGRLATEASRETDQRGTEESNLERRFWRPPCCRYTSPPTERSLDADERTRTSTGQWP